MEEKELLWKIGQRIKQIRKEKGIKQIDFSVELGIEKSNLSRLESGRVNPRIGTLYQVANALEISLPELLTLEE